MSFKEGPNSCQSKDKANVKVFADKKNRPCEQTDGPKILSP